MKRIILLVLSVLASSYANFDMDKAIQQGVEHGLGMVGGWLVLGVLIAVVFAFINRKK